MTKLRNAQAQLKAGFHWIFVISPFRPELMPESVEP